MEFEKVFSTLGILLVAILAFFSFVGGWNTTYSDDAGSSASNTYNGVQETMNSSLNLLSTQSANQTLTESGSGSTSTTADLVGRGLGIITLVPRMLGIVPALLEDFAFLAGATGYVNVAVSTFLFSFAILFAYLLIVGVRRLL